MPFELLKFEYEHFGKCFVHLKDLFDVLQKNHTETGVVEDPIELISRWTNFEICGRFGCYGIRNDNDFSIKANAGTDKLAHKLANTSRRRFPSAKATL